MNTYVGGLKLTRQNDFSMFGYYINTCTEYKRKAAGLQEPGTCNTMMAYTDFLRKEFKKNHPNFKKLSYAD